MRLVGAYRHSESNTVASSECWLGTLESSTKELLPIELTALPLQGLEKHAAEAQIRGGLEGKG